MEREMEEMERVVLCVSDSVSREALSWEDQELCREGHRERHILLVWLICSDESHLNSVDSLHSQLILLIGLACFLGLFPWLTSLLSSLPILSLSLSSVQRVLCSERLRLTSAHRELTVSWYTVWYPRTLHTAAELHRFCSVLPACFNGSLVLLLPCSSAVQHNNVQQCHCKLDSILDTFLMRHVHSVSLTLSYVYSGTH